MDPELSMTKTMSTLGFSTWATLAAHVGGAASSSSPASTLGTEISPPSPTTTGTSASEPAPLSRTSEILPGSLSEPPQPATDAAITREKHARARSDAKAAMEPSVEKSARAGRMRVRRVACDGGASRGSSAVHAIEGTPSSPFRHEAARLR